MTWSIVMLHRKQTTVSKESGAKDRHETAIRRTASMARFPRNRRADGRLTSAAGWAPPILALISVSRKCIRPAPPLLTGFARHLGGVRTSVVVSK